MFEARLAYFYGISPLEMDKMSYARLQDYHMAISVIQAESAMLQLSIESFPHMKKEGQKKLEKRLQKLMRDNVETEDSGPQNTEDLYHRIMGQLSGR